MTTTIPAATDASNVMDADSPIPFRPAVPPPANDPPAPTPQTCRDCARTYVSSYRGSVPLCSECRADRRAASPAPAEPQPPPMPRPRPRPKPTQPNRGALGLVLNPELDGPAVRRLDIASLAIAALSDDESDPVLGVLAGIADDAYVLAHAMRHAGAEIGDLSATTAVLFRLERRVRIAAEIHRRMLEQAADATPEGAEDDR